MGSTLAFYKIQGCGNDFIVCSLAEIPHSFLASPESIAAICNRHYGIGSDGLMVVGDSKSEKIEVLMYNPDGSPMGMCGNGIRSVMRYLFLIDPEMRHRNSVEFVVGGRNIRCQSENHGKNVLVDMGAATFSPELIPISSKSEFRGGDLLIAENLIQGWALSMGNPHFVTFVNQIDNLLVERLGPLIEQHPFFPERTNVEFVSVINRSSIQLTVWERGAGLTLACGSGACAAVVVGISRGILDSPCRVLLPGGELEVQWDSIKENASVFLSGPAAEVFSGNYFF